MTVQALVVDDSKAMRMILSRSLRELGFEVAEAPDGKQALAALQNGGAKDLVLIDWNMPEMNGLELVQAVRADPRFAETRLVMVTTESELDHVDKALSAGANEYVMKPFTKDIIRDKLALLGFSVG
jgi:two-component system chemotaxis response regulator CheY